MKPRHTIVVGRASYTVHVGLLAVPAHMVAAAANLMLRGSRAGVARIA